MFGLNSQPQGISHLCMFRVQKKKKMRSLKHFWSQAFQIKDAQPIWDTVFKVHPIPAPLKEVPVGKGRAKEVGQKEERSKHSLEMSWERIQVKTDCLIPNMRALGSNRTCFRVHILN